MEVREAERRASHQADLLLNALAEHSLELRVKAAKETEEACQLRLKTANAEIAELQVQLDASERFVLSSYIYLRFLWKKELYRHLFFTIFFSGRDVLEMTEAIKMKEVESEAYISEIEVIHWFLAPSELSFRNVKIYDS